MIWFFAGFFSMILFAVVLEKAGYIQQQRQFNKYRIESGLNPRPIRIRRV